MSGSVRILKVHRIGLVSGQMDYQSNNARGRASIHAGVGLNKQRADRLAVKLQFVSRESNIRVRIGDAIGVPVGGVADLCISGPVLVGPDKGRRLAKDSRCCEGAAQNDEQPGNCETSFQGLRVLDSHRHGGRQA